MNLFNCFQAMAFYTMLPLGIEWLFKSGYNVWGYVAAVALLVGYVLVSMNVYDKNT